MKQAQRDDFIQRGVDWPPLTYKKYGMCIGERCSVRCAMRAITDGEHQKCIDRSLQAV